MFSLYMMLVLYFINDNTTSLLYCYARERENSRSSKITYTLTRERGTRGIKEAQHRINKQRTFYSNNYTESDRARPHGWQLDPDLLKTIATLVVRENRCSYSGVRRYGKLYRVGRNTAPPLLNDCRPDNRCINKVPATPDDFFVLSCAAVTGYRTLSFLRRVGSRILLTLLLSLANLFLLSSDMRREINFSKVPCPKSLPWHLPNIPRKNLDQKPQTR